MSKAILYTSKTCKFCRDVKEYAGFTGTELEEVSIEDSNPNNLRSAPAIEYKGELHIGLDQCTAFLRRAMKGNV